MIHSAFLVSHESNCIEGTLAPKGQAWKNLQIPEGPFAILTMADRTEFNRSKRITPLDSLACYGPTHHQSSRHVHQAEHVLSLDP